ncbi:DUF3040 domain-containing protein [Streptacidiphilus jiangxiensis]|uniref:DUF3040 domain-containing protein n=1 Tax=Streptacidiphilus jiangxiensis TaxID=235985 RepID=A0A1H7N010_STRJI|nr:DUF3040 domain-containing protein [Streptacidiphilus jiangxiensis]SEL16764.1 Protein of unknown function [Streptacidiphilus jiangxiensis]
MGLSMDERRRLEEIDRQLTSTDPRLATRLATLRPAPRRPAAVMSWNAVAVAILLFLLAAATHVALLTGLGVVLLLAGGMGLHKSWTQHDTQPPEDPTHRP